MAKFLILAASSAIGQATKHYLVDAGHTVFTTSRKVAPSGFNWTIDVSDFDAVDTVFREVCPLDGVVNCAGSLLLKSAHMTSREQYNEVINASLTTAFATVRAAGKHMTSGGSVVLISSAAASQGLANHEAIAAAKAGINGLVLSAAATYASNRLRFNAIAPGLIESPLTEALTKNEISRQASISMHALGRLGQPGDAARAIAFLLDPQNDWITGQVIGVDGGLSKVRPKPRA